MTDLKSARGRKSSKCQVGQKGQSMVELVVALPLMILLVSGLSLLFIRGAFQLELLSLTQELRVCYDSTHLAAKCRDDFRRALAELPGQWRLLGVSRVSRDHLEARVSHQLPLPPQVWRLQIN